MRIIEKDIPETIMRTFAMKTMLIFRSNSTFHGFIEYTAVRKIPNGKVYRVDKSIYRKEGYTQYYNPK